MTDIAKCYRCGTPLISKNETTPIELKEERYQSEEHILPRFLGGHLTSMRLLCKGCNTKLGVLDAELDKQLLIHRLFQFKIDHDRQRGGAVSGQTTLTGQRVLIERGMKWKHLRPIVDISETGEIRKIVCQDLKEARSILEGYKRKYPHIDVEENLKAFKEVEEQLGERVDFPERIIGGPIAFRAIAKIALGYYLHSGGDASVVSSLKEYVVNGTVNGVVHVEFYYGFSMVHDLADDEVSHIIFVRGDKRKGLLYCYVELFNTFNFIVLLSRDYEGEDYTSTYCWDVLGAKEITDKQIELKLIGDVFDALRYISYRDKWGQEIQEYLADRIDRFWRLIEELTDPRNEEQTE